MMLRRPSRAVLVAAVTSLLLPVPAAIAETPEDLDVRLERLIETLEARRVATHVPGMSLAVVIDDEIVLARGFGERDMESGAPATPETEYPIGSCSKAFTSALIADLIDEGVMSWDDAPAQWVPNFALADAAANEQVQIRDLLAHRTGLVGTDLMWYGGRATWDDMAPCIARAELITPFRAAFNYQNICYLVAGLAAGNAAESTWEDAIRTRFFEPLGMDRATLSVTELDGRDNVAQGYLWERFQEIAREPWEPAPEGEAEERERGGKWTALPFRNLDTIGPAGSINANVLDMAQWVRLQLGNGTIDGTELISAERFKEMRTPQIQVGPDITYGLGWMLAPWQSETSVSHGGNIDGFAAMVGLLPSRNAGFVLLTNTSMTSLQQESLSLVFDALYGALDQPVEEPGAAKLAGTYRLHVLGVDCEVAWTGSALTIDVPGQTTYTLLPPDEDGMRAFKGFDFIRVDFLEKADGTADRIEMHQGGQVLYLDRLGTAVPATRDVAELEPFTGTFTLDGTAIDVTVTLEAGALVLNVPNEPRWELMPPAAEGEPWPFRAMKGFSVTFNRDETGAISALGIQNPMQLVGATRSGPPTASTNLLDVDSVNALLEVKRGGDKYLINLYNVELNGSIHFVNAGMRGSHNVIFSGYDRYRSEMNLPPFGWIREVLRGDTAWSRSNITRDETMVNATAMVVRLAHPAAFLGPWAELFESSAVVARDTITLAGADAPLDEACWVVECTLPHLEPFRAWVGVSSGRVHRLVHRAPAEHLGTTLEITTEYRDWRRIREVEFPFDVRMQVPMVGAVHLTYDEAIVNQRFEWPPFEPDGVPPAE